MFCRRTRVKWHFWNKPSESFSKKQVFSPNCKWKPEGHPNLELLLRQTENELFKLVEMPLGYSNLSKEEWEVVENFG